MSMELNCAVGALEPEVMNSDAIRDAVENCFADAGNTTERALEILTPEDPEVTEDGEADSDLLPEVETAEEVSLKNGVYHEIKRKLGERYHIPSHEIAFIHEADTPAKKAALFAAANTGRVRVLIGSTSKLGTGVNVQKRLVGLHHVDEPWKPAELEQREGRILRQGNIYSKVFIFHYVTERSFDGYMLQTLESKARFISQIMAGEVTARTAEDVGDMVLTVAQVKAIASGNPLVQRRIELEVKLVKLDRLRAAFYNNRAAMRVDVEELPERIAAQEAEITGHEQAIRTRERQPFADDLFRIVLKKKLDGAETIVFDKRERAGAHLRYLADLLTERLRRGNSGRGGLTEEVGTYHGFTVSIYASGNSRFSQASTLFNFNSEIHLRAPDGVTCYVAAISESNVGITQSVDYQLRHVEDRLEQARSGLEMLRARLVAVQAEVDKPWAHAAEYHRLRKDYQATGTKLQSEGVEVESNLTFTAEGDERAEETATATEDSSGDTPPQAGTATLADDFVTHLNPFTGLETWEIVVDEPEEEATGSDGFDPVAHDAYSAALSFNFETPSTPDDEHSPPREADIFLDSPENGSENHSGGAISTYASEDSGTAADGEPEILRLSEMLVSKPASTPHNNGRHKKGVVSKKSKSCSTASTSQIGFLWS